MTLRQNLIRAALLPVVLLGLSTVGYAVASAFFTPAVVVETGAAEEDRASELVGRHDCWSGAAPTGVDVPGHVVATWQGRTRYSTRLVGPALQHLFETPVPGMTVHAFCR